MLLGAHCFAIFTCERALSLSGRLISRTLEVKGIKNIDKAEEISQTWPGLVGTPTAWRVQLKTAKSSQIGVLRYLKPTKDGI